MNMNYAWTYRNSVYPEKLVCIIKEIGDGVIPCAIPYMMHTLSGKNGWAAKPLCRIAVLAGTGKKKERRLRSGQQKLGQI